MTTEGLVTEDCDLTDLVCDEYFPIKGLTNSSAEENYYKLLIK